MSFITTDHLTLDPIQATDLKALADARNDPRVRLRTREYRALTIADQFDWHRRISSPASTDFMLAVRGKEQATSPPLAVVGLCHYNARDRTAETSFYLLSNQEARKGVMTEALGALHAWGYLELGLERIWAEVYAFNKPCLALLDNLGFTREGILRDHVYRMGERHESIMMGQLRGEWDATEIAY